MATKYVAQTAAGANDGSNAGNAYSIAQINAASPYSPAGDDVIVLTGIFTTQLAVPTSGTSGHPITYQFATGAKFSVPYWGVDTSSAIVVNGKNYIIIDGQNVGIIENTANGDSLANHQLSDGIYVNVASGCIIKNLTIQNIYVHTYGTPNNPGGNALPYGVNAIKALDSTSLQVTNCIIHDAYTALLYEMTTGSTQTGPNFSNNTVSACSTAAFISSTASGQTMDSIVFSNNDVTMGVNWYEVADENHIDGLHTATGSPSNYGVMTNIRVFSNYIHGDPSTNCSGYIYLSDVVTSGYVYNNLLVGAANHPAEGYIYYNLAGVTTIYTYNNTIIGLGTTNAGGIGICYDGHTGITENAYIKNNIISSCYIGVADFQNEVIWSSDYNDYYNIGNIGNNGSFQTTLANWQAITGGDTHSTISSPNLNGSYFPIATSAAIGAGTDLSGTFTTDKNGSIRGTPWWMGCYQTAGSIVSNGYKRIGRYLRLFGPSA